MPSECWILRLQRSLFELSSAFLGYDWNTRTGISKQLGSFSKSPLAASAGCPGTALRGHTVIAWRLLIKRKQLISSWNAAYNCLVLLAEVDVLSAPEHLRDTFDYVPVLVYVISCTVIPVFKIPAPTSLMLHSCHIGVSEEVTAWL